MTSAMTTPFRPRRSLLFVPGANARALEKSDGLAADVTHGFTDTDAEAQIGAQPA